MKMHQMAKKKKKMLHALQKPGILCIRGGRQVFGKSSHHPNIFLMVSISNARENLENISHCGVLWAVTCSWQRGGWDAPLFSLQQRNRVSLLKHKCHFHPAMMTAWLGSPRYRGSQSKQLCHLLATVVRPPHSSEGRSRSKRDIKRMGEGGARGGHLSELAPHRPRENPALWRVGIMPAPLRTLGILLQLVSYKPPTAFLHPPVTQTKTVFSKLTEC